MYGIMFNIILCKYERSILVYYRDVFMPLSVMYAAIMT